MQPKNISLRSGLQSSSPKKAAGGQKGLFPLPAESGLWLGLAKHMHHAHPGSSCANIGFGREASIPAWPGQPRLWETQDRDNKSCFFLRGVLTRRGPAVHIGSRKIPNSILEQSKATVCKLAGALADKRARTQMCHIFSIPQLPNPVRTKPARRQATLSLGQSKELPRGWFDFLGGQSPGQDNKSDV